MAERESFRGFVAGPCLSQQPIGRVTRLSGDERVLILAGLAAYGQMTSPEYRDSGAWRGSSDVRIRCLFTLMRGPR